MPRSLRLGPYLKEFGAWSENNNMNVDKDKIVANTERDVTTLFPGEK